MLPTKISLAILSILVLQVTARPVTRERDEYLEQRETVLKQATREQVIRKAEDGFALFARSPFPLPLPKALPQPQPERRDSAEQRRRGTVFTRKTDPGDQPAPEPEPKAVPVPAEVQA
ncbi:hypothetical protein I317_03711 [Kwoniella heveanensis CBS 569]|nr:hypothetical protein I317_03711 [Kwoniella heveanensis CBS 569]